MFLLVCSICAFLRSHTNSLTLTTQLLMHLCLFTQFFCQQRISTYSCCSGFLPYDHNSCADWCYSAFKVRCKCTSSEVLMVDQSWKLSEIVFWWVVSSNFRNFVKLTIQDSHALNACLIQHEEWLPGETDWKCASLLPYLKNPSSLWQQTVQTCPYCNTQSL